MLRSRLPELVIASALLSLSSCGGERGERVVLSERSQRIEGGELEVVRTSVVGMYINGNDFSGVCSGTLIAQNLVLTARHCVAPSLGGELVLCGQSPFGTPFDASTLYVTADLHMSTGGTWFRGSQVLEAPGGNDNCGYDMAMLILAKSVPSSVAIPYVPRIDVAPQADEAYTAVGYGLTGPGGDPGTRMVRSDLYVLCVGSSCGASDIAGSEFQGDTGTCVGDSGGPALDVQNRVIGVDSRGRGECGSAVYGSVGAWSQWIRQGAMSAAQLGGYEPPRWAVTGSTSAPAPVPSEPVIGEQGDACSETETCADGLLCVYETTPSEAFCSARCDASTPCASGFACSAKHGACLPVHASHGGDGCSVSPVDRHAPPPAHWLAGLAVVSLGALRRRSRRRRCDG